MDGIGEHHAKWNKPISKKQRPKVFPDKWRMIYNGGGRCGEWEKNGGTLDYVEGNEGGYEKSWKETDIITLCTCMITQMVWIYIGYNHRNEIIYPICVQWIKMQSVKNK